MAGISTKKLRVPLFSALIVLVATFTFMVVTAPAPAAAQAAQSQELPPTVEISAEHPLFHSDEQITVNLSIGEATDTVSILQVSLQDPQNALQNTISAERTVRIPPGETSTSIVLEARDNLSPDLIPEISIGADGAGLLPGATFTLSVLGNGVLKDAAPVFETETVLLDNTLTLVAARDELLIHLWREAKPAEYQEVLDYIRSQNLKVVASHRGLNVLQVRIPPSASETQLTQHLNGLPGVLFAGLNQIVQTAQTAPIAPFRDDYWIDRINLERAWDLEDLYATNTPDVKVAVVDKFRKGDTHGPNVASVVRAVSRSRHSNIMEIPVDAEGMITYMSLLNALDRAIDSGAKVVNFSWQGSRSKTDSATIKQWLNWHFRMGMIDSIRKAHDNDVLVVVAAGNSALKVDDDLFPPDRHRTYFADQKQYWERNVIIVGASTSNRYVAGYSVTGGVVEIFAPSHDIRTRYHGPKLGGTSNAAPMVTGAAAIIKNIAPHLTAAQLKEALIKSADSGVLRSINCTKSEDNCFLPPPEPRRPTTLLNNRRLDVGDAVDRVLPKFAFSDDVTVTEGETATFQIKLTNGVVPREPFTLDVKVDYETAARNDLDETPTETILIPAGETSKLYTIRTASDDTVEGPEALSLTLHSTHDKRGTTRHLTIRDLPPHRPGVTAEVGFTKDHTVAEGAVVSLRVALANNVVATRAVSARVNFSDGRPPEMVTIIAGRNKANFTFTATDDDFARATPPPLELTLTDALNGAVAAGRRSVTITLQDNDPLAVVGFGATLQTLAEVETGQFRVELADGVVATRAVSVVLDLIQRHPDGSETPVPGMTSTLITIEAGTGDFSFQFKPSEPVPGAVVLRLTNPTNAVLRQGFTESVIWLMPVKPLTIGEIARGTIASDERHIWVLEIEARTFVNVQSITPQVIPFHLPFPQNFIGHVGLSPGGRLLDSTGTELASANAFPNSFPNFRDFRIERWLNPGTYFVEVSSRNGRGGSYELLALEVVVKADLVYNGPSVELNAPPSIWPLPTYYRLEVPKSAQGGEVMEVMIEGIGDAAAWLLDSEGEVLASDNYFEFRHWFDPLYNRYHYSLIQFREELNPGTYYLSVQPHLLVSGNKYYHQLTNIRIFFGPAATFHGTSSVAQVGFSIPDQTVREGNSFPLILGLFNSDGSLGYSTYEVSVVVNFSDGRNPRTVTIPPGYSRASAIILEAPDDRTANSVPSPLVLTLSDPVIAGIHNGWIYHGHQTATITPVEVAPEVGFSLNRRTALEGNTTSMHVFLVDHAGNALRATRTVRVVVNFSDGREPKLVKIHPRRFGAWLNDIALPGDGRVGSVPPPLVLTLSDPVNTAIRETHGTATIALTDDEDYEPPVEIMFATNSSRTVPEGETVTLQVKTMNDIAVPLPVSTMVTFSDGRSPEKVTIAAGRSAANFTFTATDDDAARATPPPLELTLTNVLNGAIAAGGGNATIKLRDNGDPLAVVGFDTMLHVPPESNTRLRVKLADGVVATRAVSVMIEFRQRTLGGSETPVPGMTSTLITIEAGAGHLSFPFQPPDPTAFVVVLRLKNSVNAVLREGFTELAIWQTPVNPLTIGGTGTGTINSGERHFWALELETRTFVNVQSNAHNPNAALLGRLLDSTGAELAPANILERHFRIERWLNPGTYFIEVRLQHQDATTPYELMADEVVVAADLVYNGPRVQLTAPASTRPLPTYYRLEVPESARGEEVMIEGLKTRYITGRGPIAWLLNSEGEVIASDIAATDSRVHFQRVLEPGTYYLSVQPFLWRAESNRNYLQMTPTEIFFGVPPVLNNNAEVGFVTKSRTGPEGNSAHLIIGLFDSDGNLAYKTQPVSMAFNFSDGRRPRMVTIPEGYSSMSFAFTLPADRRVGSVPPPLVVTLSDPTNATIREIDKTATVTPVEVTPQVGFTWERLTGLEGHKIDVRVVLTDHAGNELRATNNVSVRVRYLTKRHGWQTRSMSIQPGHSSTQHEFTLPDDGALNSVPSPYVLTLSDPSSNAPPSKVTLRETHKIATVTLMETRPEVAFTLQSRNKRAREGDEVRLSVYLSDRNTGSRLDATRTVRVVVNFSDGRGPMTVTIPSGRDWSDFRVRAPNDRIANSVPPPLILTLSDPANATIRGIHNTSTITVTSVEEVAPEVGFSLSRRTALEGTSVRVHVFLIDNAGIALYATRTVSVVVNFSDGREPKSVTIHPGHLGGAWLNDIALPGDVRMGPVPPPLVLTLSDPVNATIKENRRTVTIALTDDEDYEPPVEIMFTTNSSRTVPEGETVTLQVKTMNDIAAPLPVSTMVTFSDGRSPEKVTIAAGRSAANFTFTATDDDAARATPPPLELALTDVLNGAIATGGGNATIKLRDNDPLAVVGFDTTSHVPPESNTRLRVKLADGVVATRAVSVMIEFRQRTLGGSETPVPGMTSTLITIEAGAGDFSFPFQPPDTTAFVVVLRLKNSVNAVLREGFTELLAIQQTPVNLLTIGGTGTGAISSGERHFWALELETRTFVNVQSNAHNRNVALLGRLLDSTGAELAPANILERHFRIERWLNPGTYFIEVRLQHQDATTPYELMADEVVVAADLVYNGPRVQLTAPASTRPLPTYYRLEVPESARGEEVMIEGLKTRHITGRRPIVWLLNSEGEVVASDVAVSASRVHVQRVLEPGTYYLSVQPFLRRAEANRNYLQMKTTEIFFGAPPVLDNNAEVGFVTKSRTGPEGNSAHLIIGLFDSDGNLAYKTQSVSMTFNFSDGRRPMKVFIPEGYSSMSFAFTLPADSRVGSVNPPLVVTLSDPINATIREIDKTATVTPVEVTPQVGFSWERLTGLEGQKIVVRVVLTDHAGNELRTPNGVSVSIRYGRTTRHIGVQPGHSSTQHELTLPDDSTPNSVPPPYVLTLSRPSFNATLRETHKIATITLMEPTPAVAFPSYFRHQRAREGYEVSLYLRLYDQNTGRELVATRTVSVAVNFSDGRRSTTVTIPSGRIGSNTFKFRAPDDHIANSVLPPLVLTLSDPVNATIWGINNTSTITLIE